MAPVWTGEEIVLGLEPLHVPPVVVVLHLGKLPVGMEGCAELVIEVILHQLGIFLCDFLVGIEVVR